MICTFVTPSLGTCTVTRQAFGKYGFCAPKFFAVAAPDHPLAPARTYRFVDNAISGVRQSDLHNDTLCRMAIAQFLAAVEGSPEPDADGPIVPLDLAMAPFAGEVLAPNGKRLRVALVPPMYAGALAAG
jgi:hypothetical protein